MFPSAFSLITPDAYFPGDSEESDSGSSGGGLTTEEHDMLEAVYAAIQSSGNVILSAPVIDNGQTLTLVRGDDYAVDSEQPLEWSSESWPSLTNAEIVLTLRKTLWVKGSISRGGEEIIAKEGSVVADSDPQKVRIELTKAETEDFDVGENVYVFDVAAILSNGKHVTLVIGKCTVIEDQTR